MKKARRFLGIMLALLMTLMLAAPAMAEGNGKITINNAVEGQTYTIYKILDLESYNANSNAYAYKAAEGWEAFINSDGIKNVYVDVDDQGYVTWHEGADAANFAKLALAHAKDNSLGNAGSTIATATSVEFNSLDLGYYLVDSSLGTLCSLDTTNPNVTITEKNKEPGNTKTVEEDSKAGKADAYGATDDADIGQTVNFQSTITAQSGAQDYVFHDKMNSGLTFTGESSVSVTLNGTPVAASNYTVTVGGTETEEDKCTFEVAFTQAFCDTLKANDQIIISYSAALNENAVIAGNGNLNQSWLKYGENGQFTTQPSETRTYTWDVDVFKYTNVTETTSEGTTTTETGLSGAKFTLSKQPDGTSPIALIAKENNVYRVAKADETETVTEITTGSTGKFTIQGLDADTYYLTETAAPSGYNKLAGPVTITIDNDGKVNTTTENPNGVDEVKVLNQSGTKLPETGGMGTTIFYAVGAVLVLGAGVLLVTKKKMNLGE